jgi:hypothetical protein
MTSSTSSNSRDPMRPLDAATIQALTDEDMPALFGAADATSLAGQEDFLKSTRVRLGALLVAAACGVFVGRADRGADWFAWAGVLAFLTALGAELYLLVSRPERAWYEGRAAAESVKTLAWRYAVGGEPFPSDEEHVDDHFLEQVRGILTDLDDVTLDAGPNAGEQITPAMRTLRSRDLEERRRAYRASRIEDQRDWYQRKGKWNEERASRMRILAIGLEIGGVIAGFLAAVGAVRLDLLGIAAAAVATVATWLQVKQYETLSRAYSVAAQELALALSDWDKYRTEQEWSNFVDDAEEAISREHTLWRASRGVVTRREGDR